MRLWLPDTAATETLGRILATTRPARAVVHLHGDLGAGKSTLARALLRALDVRGAIRSPTYTLVERYPLGDGTEALHLDLYRIADAGELEFLGLDPEDGALWLVEWAERGGAGLPGAHLRLNLTIDADGRSLDAIAFDPTGHDWLTRLAVHPELQVFSRPC